MPRAVRKILGVSNGGVVMLNFDGAGFTLQPAATFPIELYSDARIAEFDEADAELQNLMKANGESVS